VSTHVTTVLSAGLDLRVPLHQVDEAGAALVRAVVSAQVLADVRAEIEGLPYALPPPGALPATTGSELAVLPGHAEGAPVLARLREELVRGVHRDGHGIAGLTDWEPDQIFVRRYHADSTGMSPHRDGLRFGYLVATLTVAGSATFRWEDDAGGVLATWQLRPGDLVLLRCCGLGGIPDGRPRHAVGGPDSGLRYSVALRKTIS
jgi:hypothetical protein